MEINRNFKEFLQLLNEHEAILDEVKINFLNISDLIKAKETAARLQDLADAEQLRKIREKESKKNTGKFFPKNRPF